MEANSFNYREQLVNIYYILNENVAELYRMAFTIGLEEEWPELKEAYKDGDLLPGHLDYLRLINHVTVPGLIEMIQILAIARESLANINMLTEEELEYEDVVEDESAGEIEEAGGSNGRHYLDVFMSNIGINLMDFYEAIYVLASDGIYPDDYDDFLDKYYVGGGIVIDSEDGNVTLLVEALNKVLEVNGRTEYYC